MEGELRTAAAAGVATVVNVRPRVGRAVEVVVIVYGACVLVVVKVAARDGAEERGRVACEFRLNGFGRSRLP